MEVVIRVYLVSPQTREVIVARKLDDHAVPVLLQHFEVVLPRFLVPHTEGVVAGSAVNVLADDELPVTVLAQLILEPLHLRLPKLVSIEAIILSTVVIHRVERKVTDLVCEVNSIVSTVEESRLDGFELVFGQVLLVTFKKAEPHIVHVIVEKLRLA